MRMQESFNWIEMHASFRIPGSWKFWTGSKMEQVLNTQPYNTAKKEPRQGQPSKEEHILLCGFQSWHWL